MPMAAHFDATESAAAISVVELPRPGIAIAEFDTAAYPFAPAFRDLLEIRDFAQIPSGRDLSDRQTAAANQTFRDALHKAPVDTPFMNLYYRFLRHQIPRLFGRGNPHTRHPVLRIQIPHSGSISGMHRDADYTGRWDYINGWVPMTSTPSEIALRVETGYDSQEFESIPLEYGQILFFDAGMLRHGSLANTLDQPRVSMDFRFAPKSESELKTHLVGHRPADLVKQSRLEYQRRQATT